MAQRWNGDCDGPLTGLHSQIVVYLHNWAKDGAPPDARSALDSRGECFWNLNSRSNAKPPEQFL